MDQRALMIAEATGPVGDTPPRDDASAPALVPLRRQYLQIKRRFPDTILFFRLGDFYETFDGDAEIAAAVLDIVLTGREMGKGLRVPMAGIPHHAAQGHIARLVAAGHKVAVCEQVGEVTKGRGLVERDVTRIVTPGTVLEPAMLDARRNNFVAAVLFDGKRAGIASADVSTGEFATTEVAAGSPAETALAVNQELLRLAPAEVVYPEAATNDVAAAHAWLPDGAVASPTEPWRWKLDRATDELQRHFGVESLAGFGCEGRPLAVRAAGGLLGYLAEVHRAGLGHISALATYAVDGYMALDAQTRRNLELTESTRGDRRHSLVAVLDQTKTPMGARLLRRWIGQPLLDLAPLRQRQDAVERFWADARLRGDLRAALADVGDVERLANRCAAGIAAPADLAQLRRSLAALDQVADLGTGTPGAPAFGGNLGHAQQVRALLERTIADEPPPLGKGAAIRPGFAPELDGHLGRVREAREWIAGLERSERERTGIRSLKVGYNRVFGYYLEITAAALAAADREHTALAGPGDESGNGNVGGGNDGSRSGHGGSRSGGNGNGNGALPADYLPKQTLANATRYFTPQLKEYETIVLTAQETLAELETAVFRRIVGEVARQIAPLLAVASAVAYLDVVASLAEVASVRGYVRPDLDEGGRIEIVDGRHPTLETIVGTADYIPNDAALDAAGAQITILTGPNMAGKSSWLRQVALIVLMAQIGSFVPARRATIGLVDRIFTRIGAQDDIATGQSTFMVEMLETANILHHATERSLVVLDEIGRGTSTYDGLAIARAIVEHLHNAPKLGCRTVFATHYHELTELEHVLPRVRCCRIEVLEEGERVVFLRKVVPGAADRSYGVHVAQIAGIPRGVVRRAAEILQELEQGEAPRPGASTATPGGGRRRAAMAAPAPDPAGSLQLTLFAPPHPAVEALRAVDVESLSPLEAITKLFELQRLTSGGA